MRDNQQGISNRETAAEEAEERREFPPVAPDAPAGKPEGASGSKDADGKQPSAHKVAGAGREDA